VTCSRRDILPDTTLIKHSLEVQAIYGVFHLLRGYFLAVVTESTLVAKGPENAKVFRIDALRWVPILSFKRLDVQDEHDERTYV
jgi:hypothetical protein